MTITVSKKETLNAVNMIATTLAGALESDSASEGGSSKAAAAEVVRTLAGIASRFMEQVEPSTYFDLYAAKERIKRERAIFNQHLDADNDTQNDLDGYFDDMLSDIQYCIDKHEEQLAEESPERSDWDEHNTMNKAQQGIK